MLTFLLLAFYDWFGTAVKKVLFSRIRVNFICVSLQWKLASSLTVVREERQKLTGKIFKQNMILNKDRSHKIKLLLNVILQYCSTNCQPCLKTV